MQILLEFDENILTIKLAAVAIRVSLVSEGYTSLHAVSNELTTIMKDIADNDSTEYGSKKLGCERFLQLRKRLVARGIC